MKKAKIIYSEQLSLVQQIHLWNTHPIFIGPIGSAHHGTLFALEPKKNVYLCESPLRNFMMIDTLKRDESCYISCLGIPPGFKNSQSNMSANYEMAISAIKQLQIV